MRVSNLSKAELGFGLKWIWFQNPQFYQKAYHPWPWEICFEFGAWQDVFQISDLSKIALNVSPWVQIH